LLAGGVHSKIQATYVPGSDPNYSSVVTANYTQTVNTNTATVGVASSSSPSIYGSQVVFTVTVTGIAGNALPSGTVDFFDGANSNPIGSCSSVSLTLQTASSTAQCVVNAQTHNLLSGGTHTINAVYNGDTNYSPNNGMATQIVNRFASLPVVTLTQGTNPSVVTVPLTFTAIVSPVTSGTIPSGTVTFTDTISNTTLSGCNTLALASGSVSCTPNPMLPAGNYNIVGVYSGDQNYAQTNSVGTPQTVQDFTVTSTASMPPSVVSATQSYGNTNNPFSKLNSSMTTSITYAATGTGFVDPVDFKCAVTPGAGQSPSTVPTCSLTPMTSLSNVVCNTPQVCTISAGMSTIAFALVVSATSTTPVGPYTVTVTANDTNPSVPALSRSTTQSVNVVNLTSALNLLPVGPTQPSGIGTVTATFTMPPGQNWSVTFDPNLCSVTGTNANENIGAGGAPLSQVGMTCSVPSTPVTVNGTSTINVTIATTATVAMLRRGGSEVFAAVWMGLPGLVLLGSVRGRWRTRKRVLQFLGLCLVVAILIQVVACGGSFTRPPNASGTPSGTYLVLVQGNGTYTDSTGTQHNSTFSAVVPVNVGH
jgi:hypothetical protein